MKKYAKIDFFSLYQNCDFDFFSFYQKFYFESGLLASSNHHEQGELDAHFFQNDLNALSALRVLRVLKLCRSFQGLRVVITGLVQATRSILWVSCFALFLILIFAIVLTNAIGKNVEFARECSQVCGECANPNDFHNSQGQFLENEFEYCYGWGKFKRFDSTVFTLFEMLTLEQWTFVAHHVSSKLGDFYKWFLLFYVLLANFVIMSLFIAVIVEQFQHVSSMVDLDIMRSVRERQNEVYGALRTVFHEADVNNDGCLTLQEFKDVMENEDLTETMHVLGISSGEVEWIFDMLDIDYSGSLTIDEFITGCLNAQSSEQSRQLMQVQYILLKEIRRTLRDAVQSEIGHQMTSASNIGSSAPGREATNDPLGDSTRSTDRPGEDDDSNPTSFRQQPRTGYSHSTPQPARLPPAAPAPPNQIRHRVATQKLDVVLGRETSIIKPLSKFSDFSQIISSSLSEFKQKLKAIPAFSPNRGNRQSFSNVIDSNLDHMDSRLTNLLSDKSAPEQREDDLQDVFNVRQFKKN